MRGVLRLAAVIAILGACVTAASAAPPRVTVIGDSVQASFDFSPDARARLGAGLDLRMEAKVCRRLVSASCSYDGHTPETALGLVRRLGPSLGQAVVINVGYNDDPGGYDIGAVLTALRGAGVRAVVLVTLRETRGTYAITNRIIRDAARRVSRPGRSPVVRVADWGASSAGRPWFAGDGLHLSSAGALGLATLLREHVLAGLADAGVAVPGRPVTLRVRSVPLGRTVERIAAGGRVLWLAGAGRVTGLEESGRRLPGAAPLAPGEDLASDGRAAWLRDAAAGAITRLDPRAPGLRGVRREGVGAQPGGGEPVQALIATGRTRAIAADGRDLWLLVAAGGGAARLERRDSRTGRLLRTTRLPRAGAGGSLVASRGGAWVLARDGRLLGVRRDGHARRVPGRLRGIGGMGAELWAVAADRRTLLRLHPRSGRAVGRAVADRPLSGRIALTRGHAWALAASGRHVVRVARP